MKLIHTLVAVFSLGMSLPLFAAAGGPIVIKLSGSSAAQAAAVITVDGRPYTPNTVIQDTVFPTQHCVRIEGVHVQYWYANSGIRQPPLMNGNHWLMGSTNASVTATHTAYVTTSAYWVDPTNGVDNAECPGTQEAPFRTPLYAAERAEFNSVIYCAQGDYREGEYYYNSMTNRLYNYNKNLRFVGAGIGRSILHGKLDLESPTHLANGLGPAAMRAMTCTAGSYSVLQNFTVTEGRCATIKDGKSTPDQGGGGYNAHFADCLVTNCASWRGQAIYMGTLVRCRVLMCDSAAKATTSRLIDGSAVAYCSIFGPQNPGMSAPFEAYTCWQCTAGWRGQNSRVYGANASAYNCASVWSATPTDAWSYTMRGCVTKWDGTPSAKLLQQDVLNAAPLFVDAANGDYRLFADSPAVGYGYLPENYYRTYSAGIDGAPVTFKDGKPTAGAVQGLASVVSVPAAGAYAATDVPAGRHLVEPGESLTVNVVNAKRPPIGFVVNGETVPGTAYTFTAPAGSVGAVANIGEIAIGTNWYANAAMPNDDGDGFTPETAKKTLISLCTNQYVLAGDRIHAAAGKYAEGAKAYGSQTLLSRAIVKNGVTLVGDEGQTKTFIVGAPATVLDDPAKPGLGVDAIRCATVENGGALEGFSLTNGYTRYANSGKVQDENYAGGFFACGKTAEIRDCTITDCRAARSGLSHGGRYYRCRLVGGNSAVPRFDDNRANYWGGFYNSQVCLSSYWFPRGPHVNCVLRNTGNAQIYFETEADLRCMTNCVIFGSVRNTGTSSNFRPANSNNIVCTGLAGTATRDEDKAWFKVLTLDQIKAAYDYATLEFKGVKDANFCDAGINVAGQESDTDVNGGQRIYNGTVDLGSAEYDWRGDFAATFGRPGVEITAASPTVTTNALGKVRLDDGASVTMRVSRIPARRVGFSVEDGVLTAMGGMKDMTYDADGEYPFRSVSNLTFSFLGAGSAVLEQIIDCQGIYIMLK